jgi:hypothetical protein
MKKVTRNAVSNVRMVAGNEKKHPRVILDGIVKNWVGFGWVDEGKATTEDKRKYPTVED